MIYSIDFRKRALEAVRNGHSKTKVNEMLNLSANTLKKWEKLEEETGSLKDKPSNRKAYKIDREKLLQYYKENPYSTDKETAEVFNCSKSGIEHARKALKITRKKTQFHTKKEMNKNEKSLLRK